MVNRSRGAARVVALCVFAALLAANPAHALSCLNNDGHSVPWFFTYKLPDGFNIAYVDSKSTRVTGPLQQYPSALDAASPPALIQTLEAMGKSSSSSYVLYNDQPPSKTVGSQYGHSKGVVGVASRSALWIIHSTPHWPLDVGAANQWDFPSTETIYGQTFMCITLGSNDVDTVAKQLLYIRPYVYASTLTPAFTAKYPTLASVVDGSAWVLDAGSSVATLHVGSSSSSVTATHLAKNAKWDNDLYEHLVAPHFDADLLVESWMRGEELGPYCKPTYPYDVTDVETLIMAPPVGSHASNTTWKETQDHSKWCVSPVKGPLVCVADENRMTSQRKRGGGALCFTFSVPLYRQLMLTINTAAQC